VAEALTTTDVAATPSPPASPLSRRILYGVLAGAATGLVFGEATAVLQIVADGYVRLLQMTVLPYVTISIVTGLGALDAQQARTLGKRVGVVLMLLWGMALAAALLVSMTFPRHESASFFSTTLLQEREGFDVLGLYIPTNPFNSLANSVVPAVVLFSIVVGVALIGVPRKARLLEVMGIANDAIGNATKFIVSLTPYGVFAIAAVVSGTLSLETLGRLQVYLVSYVAMALLLSLWLLPGLVAALTPVPFRAVLSRTRNALVLAFMTTSLFAVLPLLIDDIKQLLRDYAGADAHDEALPDVIVPASFNFPHTGKLLSLSFVLFAAWFSDTRVAAADYIRLAGTGLVVMFGNVNAAIPFLLDQLKVPSDTFQLFLASGVVNARFGTLVAATHTVAVALIGTCAITGRMRIDPRKLLRFGALTAALTVATVGGLRLLLEMELRTPYDKDQVIASMEAVRNRGDARTFKPGDAVPPLPPVTTSILDRARGRGVIRVGYFDDSLPYAFFNGRGDLVGFDVEMAQQFGRDLAIGVEFVPVSRSVLESGVDPALCDLVMSGAVITADRAIHVQFSVPYLDETVAFVVLDHQASSFEEWSKIREKRNLRIGVPRGAYFKQKIQDELPDAELVPIGGMDEIFTPYNPPLDAFVATAERGSAYTILHPAYGVAVPKPRPFKVPLGYAVAGRDQQILGVLNTWINLKTKDGTIDELFVHWILGQDARQKPPRWSVIRNVLHLVG
jgi:Na+/H+-dicarboxylate symporter/ABC-type amino acid transport substrate-binding protein